MLSKKKCKHKWEVVSIDFTPRINWEKGYSDYTNAIVTSHCVCLKCKSYKTVELKNEKEIKENRE